MTGTTLPSRSAQRKAKSKSFRHSQASSVPEHEDSPETEQERSAPLLFMYPPLPDSKATTFDRTRTEVNVTAEIQAVN